MSEPAHTGLKTWRFYKTPYCSFLSLPMAMTQAHRASKFVVYSCQPDDPRRAAAECGAADSKEGLGKRRLRAFPIMPLSQPRLRSLTHSS